MAKLLNYLTMVVAGWVVISPFVLGYQSSMSIGVSIGGGLCVIVLALISIRRKADQWPSMVVAALGGSLILWGAFIGRLVGASAGANEVLVGIFLVLLGCLVLPFQIEVAKAVFYNRNGGELANTTKIRVKDGNLLAKSTLLGSMPETIYVRPEELCKMASMMELEVILAIPAMLYQGWKINRAQSNASEKAKV